MIKMLRYPMARDAG